MRVNKDFVGTETFIFVNHSIAKLVLDYFRNVKCILRKQFWEIFTQKNPAKIPYIFLATIFRRGEQKIKDDRIIRSVSNVAQI